MRFLIVGLALALSTPAAAQVPLDPARAAELRKAGAEVLFWSQEQKDRNFRAMETVFPTVPVKAGPMVSAMTSGAPLPLPEAEVDRFMASNNVAGLLVLADGQVRLERYARGFAPEQRWTSFSVAKSLTSMLFGTALKEGKLALSDPVTRFIPELQGSAYDGVTVEQVLTMSSGVHWNEDYTDPKSDVATMFSLPTPDGQDVIVNFMKRLPRAHPPGTRFNYNTGETNLAGTILARAVGKPIHLYASEALWQPHGMEADALWQVDEKGQPIAGCCISMRLRDYGRMGQLVLDGGMGLLAPEWVEAATTVRKPFAQPGRGYGYFWWIEPTGYRASGIFGQQIWIDPKRRLVVVALSAWPRALDGRRSAERTAFLDRIAAAADEK